MTMPAVPPLPAPLAEHAATATRPAGPCALCQCAIVTRERYASLIPSGRLAHLPCIGQAAMLRTRVPVIR